MTAVTFKSPEDLIITPRDRRFGRGTVQKRWWLRGDPIATAFYNALSITFPRGEAYFVESVRAFRDGTPPKLEREIKAFITQEVMHSREHVAFNNRVVEAGYDITALEKKVVESLELTKGRPGIFNLCVTMALEHYTAIMAQQLLEDPRVFAGADPEQAALWKWHAIEEIEHKGVAYDTWTHASRDWTRGKRWRIKSLIMLIVTKNFWINRYDGVMQLLAQDGIKGLKAHARVLWFLFGNPGLIRGLFLPWARFFLPGFHPWNHDDRHLIQRADSDYEAARLPEARVEARAA